MRSGIKAPTLPAHRQITTIEELREKNRCLKNDLYAARRVLIALMDSQDLLHRHICIDNVDQLDEWRNNAAEAVIKEALVRSGEEMGDPRWPRAICPLCRRSALGPQDVKGYAIPEGLHRHLLGEYNSQQCPVFAAAESIARDRVYEVREDAQRSSAK